MSFFLLCHNNVADDRLRDVNRALDAAGFAGSEAQMINGHSLSVYSTLGHAEPPRQTRQGNDWTVTLGSLIFSGKREPQAQVELLTRFSTTSFDWQGLLGTHTCIVHKDRQLHLFADGLGATRLYTNDDRTIWSNSFLAMCELVRPTRFNKQACYEYVIAGSVYGDKTLTEGITALPANSIVTVDEAGTVEVVQRPSPIDNRAVEPKSRLDEVAASHCRQLDAVFGPIADNYGDRIRLSFSGGFDSRLMLAMLLRHGAKPALFVYGDDNDEDVRIARLICASEGLPLEVIDKSLVPPVPPDAFVEETERNLFAFDGWKVEAGLFDFGADRKDRSGRHAAGQVPLNGSLGEIYRNFFYMPDRPASIGAVISTFYSRYDPLAFTERFDENEYRAGMAKAMREAIGVNSDRLSRAQVEEVYPKFRGRFWTGRDASINQRFGPMFFPYLEHAAISNTAKIPIRHKDLGRLQGRMIAHVSQRLADYPSDYGFALDGPRPLKYRLKTFLGTQRPPALRKASFRLTHRSPEPRTGALAPEYLGRVIDLDYPVMRKLFRMDGINSAIQYGLIATLEYLGQRYGLDVADN